MPATLRPLRLSLVHQTVLLLVAAVLLAVTALGGVVAWNLRAGFSDYLRLQDQAWLERFAVVAARAVAQGGLAAIGGPAGSLRPLLEAAGPDEQRGGGRDVVRPPRDDFRERRPPPPGVDSGRGPGPGEDRDGPPQRRLPPGAQRYANRLSIATPEGRLLSGRPPPPGALLTQQAITVNEQTVAWARLEPGPPAGQGVDANFLARQYRGILLAAVALVLLAVAGAVWVGRRWLRPVQEARQAARCIADGAFNTRLTPRGNNELSDLALDINSMASSLQQLEASRRRWIAELSHEMRTPLAVLRGEVECLIDGVRPLGQPAMLSLQAEVARLTRLVEDFHQLALSDLRALPCTFAPLDAAALVHEATARVAARAVAAGLTLECHAPSDPLPVAWDRQRIEQLLANLLENSLRYTNTPGRVQLTLEAMGLDTVNLTLDDSAPGVPAAGLARLFEPLYRADPSRSRRSGGSGLGLAICQAIVRSHGGRISTAPSPLGGLRVV